MRARLVVIAIVLAGIFQAKAKSKDGDDFYVAGVVEFQPKLSGASSSELLEENLAAYAEIITSEEAVPTDIIVFPEHTLNNELQLTYVPAETSGVDLCNEQEFRYAKFLKKLACLARDTHKYLVVNILEKEDCNQIEEVRPCSQNKLNVFNTNVVFNRDGKVISRYRKINAYNENINTTMSPEFGIFETDFGVKFGHFICFDLLFYTPVQTLVNEYKLKHLIMTSMFYSELPFLTAVQLQQSWAWANNVTLLAAGASSPKNGMTGTGIHAGAEGSLVSVMATGFGKRKLYVATVQKNSGKRSNSSESCREEDLKIEKPDAWAIELLQDPNITEFSSTLLDSDKLEAKGKVCHKDFCCNYDIAMDTNRNDGDTQYRYRIGAFIGRRTYLSGHGSDIAVCSIYACSTEYIQDCGKILNSVRTGSQIHFQTLNLAANFVKKQKMLIMPNTLDTNLLPFSPGDVNWSLRENWRSYDANISIKKTTQNLLTFGIYTKYYDE